MLQNLVEKSKSELTWFWLQPLTMHEKQASCKSKLMRSVYLSSPVTPMQHVSMRMLQKLVEKSKTEVTWL